MACDAENYSFQMLNDDEIGISLQEESHPVDDETDEGEDSDNNESSKSSSNDDAFSALETAMKVSGFIYYMDRIRLSEQSRIGTVSGSTVFKCFFTFLCLMLMLIVEQTD
ncbi:hypothetical protein TNCV_223211 [Trichonephila clavipes]|nr:hypothetical protein TNCV_223211 [Trichonephila clavipes]